MFTAVIVFPVFLHYNDGWLIGQGRRSAAFFGTVPPNYFAICWWKLIFLFMAEGRSNVKNELAH
jgi:hypothetical protein